MTKLLVCLSLLSICIYSCNTSSWSNSDSKVLDLNESYKLTTNVGDTLISFHILMLDGDMRIRNNATYTWFLKKQIYETQGDYSGQLLHGDYEAFYQDRLIAKGVFMNGLKHGTWKLWSNSGRLKEIAEYKNGVREGSFAYYDPPGTIREEGEMDEGRRSGKVTYYFEGDSTAVVKYRSGIATDTVGVK